MNLQIANRKVTDKILLNWKSNTLKREWTFHQLSPYIGKVKSSLASSLISYFTKEGDLIYDPFCGAGTIPFEAWAQNRSAIGNDLNAYAYVLAQAKMNPPNSLQEILVKIQIYQQRIVKSKKNIDLRSVPKWVRAFFHTETLREVITWCNELRKNNEYFLLACLLGILHHQRPGFLSYPSSHTVPYLRLKKFPKNIFPDMYKYRSVMDRLERKVVRAFKKVPDLDRKLKRKVFCSDAALLKPAKRVNAIITSPPYMRQLDYGRDNRLRL